MSQARRTSVLIVVSLALFTDTVLYYLLVPLLPAFARQYGLGQMSLGLLFGCYSACLLLATFPLGALADRVGRRAPMLWGLVGLGAATLLFAYAQHFWLLVVARGLQGISATATWTAGMALLADHFPTEGRGRAMGTVFAFANLGVLIGPPAAGFLFQHFGMRVPFLVGAGLVALDAVARICLIREMPHRSGVQVDFRSLLGNDSIRVLAGVMAMGAAMWALLESVLPLHFDRTLHMGSGAIGLCFGLSGLAHMATSPLMGWCSDRVGRRRVLTVGFVCAALLLPLPVIFHSLFAVQAVMLALGLTASFLLSPVSPAMTDAVERMGSSSFGAMFGLVNFAYALGLMAGPLVGSGGVALMGLRATLVAVAVGFLGYTLLLKRVRS
ncbi:MAG TPA: MFS transporter [Holophaga sp.]|jgi:MFS family permease|nr:MFS transporter [Holophaga sp.]